MQTWFAAGPSATAPTLMILTTVVEEMDLPLAEVNVNRRAGYWLRSPGDWVEWALCRCELADSALESDWPMVGRNLQSSHIV